MSRRTGPAAGCSSNCPFGSGVGTLTPRNEVRVAVAKINEHGLSRWRKPPARPPTPSPARNAQRFFKHSCDFHESLPVVRSLSAIKYEATTMQTNRVTTTRLARSTVSPALRSSVCDEVPETTAASLLALLADQAWWRTSRRVDVRRSRAPSLVVKKTAIRLESSPCSEVRLLKTSDVALTTSLQPVAFML